MARKNATWGILHLGACVGVVLFAGLLLNQALAFNQEQQPFAPNVPEPNEITLPTIGIAVNGTRVLIEPDISISISLSFQGPLVAGEQTPVNLSVIAISHVPSQNVSRIFVQFQDALNYPNIPAQVFKQNATAVLYPSQQADYFGGSRMVYFPLDGDFAPIVSVEANETNIATGNMPSPHFYLPRVMNIALVHVQPTTVLNDEQAARDNLKLTYALYVIGIVGLVAIGLTEAERTHNNFGRASTADSTVKAAQSQLPDDSSNSQFSRMGLELVTAGTVLIVFGMLLYFSNIMGSRTDNLTTYFGVIGGGGGLLISGITELLMYPRHLEVTTRLGKIERRLFGDESNAND